MIKFINSWAQGIILAVIIATIIEIIIPEGNNKKYVKTVIGLYILFTIIYPLITKISGNKIDFNSIIATATKETYQYDNLISDSIETNTYIENTYKNKLKEDIKNKVEEKGYTIFELNIYVETKNEDIYGQINSIVMELNKTEKDRQEINSINNIEQIDINISNNTEHTIIEEKEVSDDEIKTIKEFLSNTYSVEKEKIHIND